jgi:hypothetical protein
LDHARQTKLRSAKFWSSLFSCSCLLKHDKRLPKVLSRLNGSKQTRKEEFFRLIDFQIPDLVLMCDNSSLYGCRISISQQHAW